MDGAQHRERVENWILEGDPRRTEQGRRASDVWRLNDDAKITERIRATVQDAPHLDVIETTIM